MTGPLPARRALLAIAIATLGAATAHAAETELDGRASLRALSSFDSGASAGADNPSVQMYFLETDLQAKDLNEDGLRLQLDASFRFDPTQANERRFGETESLDQIRQLYVEQPAVAGAVDVGVGRRILPVAGNAWVDGVDLELLLGNQTAGVYGGLFPDPFDYSLNTRYQTFGVYGTHSDAEAGLEASVAYNTVLLDGTLDRHYVFNRTHYKISNGLYLATFLVVDLVKEADLTTGLLSLDYTPTPAINFVLNLSRYSLEVYRNQTIYHNIIEPNQALILGDEVLDIVYDRARFSASMRFLRHYYHYQQIEVKNRQQDDQDAWSYLAGIRDMDFLGSSTAVDLSASVKNNFQSDSFQTSLNADRDFWGEWTASLRLTYFTGRTVGRATERGRSFDEAQEVLLFGGAASWRPARGQHLDVSYDGVYEAELQDARNQDNLLIHTLMGRYTIDF